MALRESDRLAALAQTRALDVAAEPIFDTVVALVAELFDAPMAAMTLLDDAHQWFKAEVGVGHDHSPRAESVCAVVVDENRPLHVRDARLDPRFANLPLVERHEFVSYLGVPIAGLDGLPLGALCVLDVQPRDFSPARIDVLRSLARMLGGEFDLRRRDTLAGLDPNSAHVDAQEIRAALDHNELRVFYQPLLNLDSGRLHSVEALVRWQHPTRGLLAPADFLPTAEVAGLGHAIDRWVLQSAAETAAQWRRSVPHLAEVRVAVNVGLGPLIDEAWADEVSGVLAKTGLPPHAMTLEVSERSICDLGDRATNAIELMAARGCRIAIDDIGTGTSSLVRLAELPTDQVKIDRAFVQSMGTDRRSAAIVHAVARLGRELSIEVVAEGVEDVATAELVRAAGCSVVQGYLWCRPVDASTLAEVTTQWSKSVA